MRAIFISYRRDDTEGQAGRLYDDLVKFFGDDKVFMDVAGIEPGRDFRSAIDEQVTSCGVLLAIIGKDWINAKDATGRPRLEDPSDFVRLETASALKRDIPVIPVLVHGAAMPHPEQLPADLADLAYRNAVELTHARWNSDVEVLVKALRPYVEKQNNDLPILKTAPINQNSGKVLIAEKPGSPGENRSRVVDLVSEKRFRWRTCLVIALLTIVAIGVYVRRISTREEVPKNSVAEELTGSVISNKNTSKKSLDKPSRLGSDQSIISSNTERQANSSNPRPSDLTEGGLIAKSEVNVEYWFKEGGVPPEQIVLMLKKKGYSTVPRPSSENGNINALWFGSKVPTSYVKEIAITLVNANVTLQGIQPFCGEGLRSNSGPPLAFTVQLLYDKDYNDRSALDEETVINASDFNQKICQ